ncbi:DEAD/DEAH box helicase family protein [Waterburya agarophytonicola K14]|uniref:DEAD/DEAH box helicase family protein n=1 Tax=Waterburya agarophytonicola KI4 TaxID=2874699 RepID=A0A964FHX7_9CYAN|nr:DEAD/DEAH box helicase family protein [Waterburya agarophytonicola]MCC0179427.1 DEAD/DEAH box helicase family protein [Waterburya agarophytonicola KI4]
MNLSDIYIQDHYRSDRHNLIQDFYVPCLSQTILYSRAVGYFSSTSIVSISQGLAALIKAGGNMRLVASPQLSREDIKAIEKGLKQKEEVISKAIIQEFETVSQDRLTCLSWLLSQGILDIKLAVANNFEDPGLYHEKIGVLTDGNNNRLAFTGSINETKSGLIDNFENIEIFCSWRGEEAKRVKRINEDFERLWLNKTPKAEVISFPEAAARKLLEYCPYAKPTVSVRKKSKLVAEDKTKYDVEEDKSRSLHSLDITLRPYQEEALVKFKSANYKGILAMATGAGKTITALACASSIEDLDLIIVVVPIKDLVQQWMDELDKLTDFYYPIPAVGKSETWRNTLYKKLRLIHGNVQAVKRLPTVVVGTYSGLSRSTVAELIEDAGGLPIKSLMIADEVHTAGSSQYRRILRDDFTYRLGLSATPIRPHDEEGTEFVLDYFGDIVYELSLEEAIGLKILCEYEYYVYVVTLTDAENEEYQRLTKKIAKLLRSGNDKVSGSINRLTIERSRIIKSASEKITVLGRIIQDHPLNRGMVYCADINQADIVCHRLSQKGINISRFTSKEDKQRPQILNNFSQGRFDALVAVKCLDEGVNVPAAQEAIILASDTSERQFIQRRGRILRKAKGKERATLIDILVVPPIGDGQLKLITSEVKRIKHFAKTASNKASVITKLGDELSHYGITYSDLILLVK